MSPEKEKQLFDTYSRFVKIALESTSEEELDLVSIVDMMGYGTAKDEIITNVEEAKKLVKNQREQGEGWNIRFETTPIYNRVSPKEDSAIIVEEKKLIMSAADNEEHILELRLTAVLEYIDNQWKVVHWHGSIPQESTSEDTWHINEWQRKNEELQIMVDEKTAELSNKYRELEIEAAVERIRAKALVMHHSEEIQKVAVTMRNELLNLKLEGVVAATIWIKQENGKIRCWDITKVEESAIAHEVNIDIEFYPEEVSSDVYFWKIWNPTGAYWVAESDVKGLYAAEAWLRTFDEKSADEFKPLLDSGELQHMWHATVPLTKGRLTIDTVSEPDRELEFILPKVGSAFDLAYQRFEDLQKAEAQARESELELSLERVRSRTMAMQASGELGEVSQMVFEEMCKLGLNPNQVTLATEIADFKRGFDFWIAAIQPSGDISLVKTYVPYFKNPINDRVITAIGNGTTFYREQIDKKVKNAYFLGFSKYSSFKLPKDRLETLLNYKSWHRSIAISEHVLLQMGRYDGEEYSAHENDMLIRFNKVLNQTYTRFLDLQKAEVQTREAQIEAALERVRAASMAMHDSEELIEVIEVLFNQFHLLDLQFDSVSIVIPKNSTLTLEYWVANDDYISKINIPDTNNPVTKNIWKNLKANSRAFQFNLNRKQNHEWWKHAFEKTGFGIIPPDRKKALLKLDGFSAFLVGHENSYIQVAKNSVADFTEGDQQIAKRFSQVFEQCYTRFLDLQKAEEQAREAQIEAALERVRAATMAMHKSEQLAETAEVLYTQLSEFGDIPSRTSIAVFKEEEDILEVWATDQIGGQIKHAFTASLQEKSVISKAYKAWKKGEDKIIIPLRGAELKRWIKYCEGIGLRMDSSKIIEIRTHNIAFFSHGLLLSTTNDPISKEGMDLLVRFAKVFDQTYTRFLDLQKAEAQTREAQIEAALERIRSRSMAMHDSEELGDVASLLYKELIDLGISNFFNCGFIIMKEEEGEQYGWLTQPEGDFEEKLNLPYPGDTILKNRLKAWKAREPVFFQKVGGKTLVRHLKYVADRSHSQHQVENFMPFMPDPTYFYCGNFSEGYLHIITGEELGEEAEAIIARFSKVFEQTYTRFLDLQKAEAQAREAQIEAALERVRAASMAMHKTEELNQLIGTVFTQLKKLGFETIQCEIILFNTDTNSCEIWPSNEVENILPRSYHIPYNKYKFYQFLLDSWQLRKDYFPYELKGMTKKAWENWLFNQTDWENIPKAVQKSMREVKKVFLYGATTSHGILEVGGLHRLEKGMFKIVQRFAKVFEQSYTRFLDLQKAEAQARKAEIEAALERVRARSMAMYKSDELTDVATVLHKEFIKLEIPEFHEANIVVIDEENNQQSVWSAHTESSTLEMVTIPLLGDQILGDIYEKWRRKAAFFCRKVAGVELQNHTNFVIPETYRTEAIDVALKGMPDPTFFNCAFFSTGYLELVADKELSASSSSILTRFAMVFEQSYTRFLDLKKAEAQAREAQIEAALERVRAASMAMHQSEELHEVVTTVFEQLKKLGLKLDSTLIHIYQKEDKEYHWWAAATGQKYSRLVKVPVIDHPFFTNFNNAHDSGVKIFSDHLSKKDKNSFFEHLYLTMEGNKVPKERKKFISDKAGIAQSVAFMHHTAFIMLNYDAIPYSSEENEILLRFASVFEQSYTRFLDLKKAEAQAREAQIEAALERVRATSMAMHNSRDLHQVIIAVYNQLQSLGLTVHSAQISDALYDHKDLHFWIATNNQAYPEQLKMPITKNAFFTRFQLAQQNGESSYSQKLSKRQKDNFFKIFFNNPNLPDVPKSRQDFIYSCPGLDLSTFITKDTAISIMRYDGIPYRKDENEIIKRFAQVFEQTYTRFLDLQKAELQARESQIEAALERVRAASMAMHKSQDLHQVIVTTLNQLVTLGLVVNAAQILVDLHDQKILNIWMAANGQVYPKKIHFPINNHTFFTTFFEAVKKGASFYTQKFTKKEKDALFEHFFENSNYQDVPQSRKDFIYAAPGHTLSNFINKDFGMCIMRYDGCSYTQEENEIIKRFGLVFGQSYTRFLDLQKAEEQAQEAKIEAALERVRARTMAMHDSSDIAATVLTFFEELTGLGLDPSIRCGVGILSESEEMNLWTASKDKNDAIALHSGSLDMTIHPLLVGVKESWKKKSSYSYILEGGDTKAYFKAINKAKNYPVKIDLRKLDDIIYQFTFCFPDGVLYVFSNTILTKGTQDIFNRFTKVFGQAYTRYKDLVYAEARVREAQIEAALERVRSAGMAMHHTDEFSNVAVVLFDQLKALGIDSQWCWFAIVNDEKKYTDIWYTEYGGKFNPIPSKQLFDDPEAKGFVKAWREKESFYTYQLKGKALFKYIKVLGSDPDFKKTSSYRIMMKNLKGCLRVNHSFFKYGALGFSTFTQCDLDILPILGRFATTFEQTYTRFLDLQKAEAQAREAQIEAALERVRAASMAMHHPEELSEVISVLFKQFDVLDISPAFAHLTLFDDGDESFTFRLTDTSGERVMAQQRISLKEVPAWIDAYNAWKDGDENTVDIIQYTQEVLPFVFDLMGDLIKAMPPKSRLKVENYPEGLWTVQGHCKFGYLGMNITRPPAEEDKEIVGRFAKEFGRVYQRFLDLQKAEAQAQEAQIEAALERVRAASMAMHNSKEMQQVANVIYDQLLKLGLEMDAVGMSGVIHPKSDYEVWVGGSSFSEPLKIPYTESTQIQKEYNRIIAKRPVLFSKTYSGKIKKEYIDFLLGQNDFPEELKQLMVESEAFTTSITFRKNSSIQIARYKEIPYSEEENDILIRFGKVFEQAYIRYLDLKKAEAQAREAQIEAALERVRSASMAMHKSSELRDVVSETFDQFQSLNLPIDGCQILNFEDNSKDLRFWSATPDMVYPVRINVPYFENPIFTKFWQAKKRGESFAHFKVSLSETMEFYNHVYRNSELGTTISKERWETILAVENGFSTSWSIRKNTGLWIFNFQDHEFTKEENSIIQRFAIAFERTYTRFLDLQKAEEQAREAQIEASLERVRAKSMAMHRSQDLHEVALVVFDQLENLGLKMNSALIYKDINDDGYHNFWVAANGQMYPALVSIPIIDTPVFKRFNRALQNQEDFYSESYSKEIKDDFFTHYFNNSTHTSVPRKRKEFIYSTDGLIRSTALNENTCITIMQYGTEPYTEEENTVISRIGQVFEQSYRRYLDLKRAEAQAREAQIEASLERVRAKTMAMHNSQDVGITVMTLFDELVTLGIDKSIRCGIGILGETTMMELWTASSDSETDVDVDIGHLDMSIHPLLENARNAWKNKKETATYELVGDEILNYFTIINNAPDYPVQIDLKSLPERILHYDFVFPNGILFAFTNDSIPEEIVQIFKRFAVVFGHTYTRFLDLQQAEERARESEIETALERVRGKAMAMHSSEDLTSTVSLLITELKSLNINPSRCGLGKMHPDTGMVELYIVVEVVEGEENDLEMIANIKLTGNAIFNKIYKSWEDQSEYLPVLEGRVKDSYYKALQKYVDITPPPKGSSQFGYFSWYKNVGLYSWSDKAYSEDELIIYRKFNAVLALTFKRFQDLKDAETRALEALQEASLDRVRAEIASMRTADDLERITPLIWRELTTLKVPFFRCGVFIVDEKNKVVNSFLSTPEGESLAAMETEFGFMPFFDNAVVAWRQGKVFRDQWDKEQFNELAKTMLEQGLIESKETYQKSAEAPEILNLHLVPFVQGLLYVGSSSPLSEDQIELVQDLANAFSVAYARYEDFDQLEKAKSNLEATLNDLKSTQTQLIQAEKMASLGELTAGIAHEIQNPLNFVNNFSEVSSELLEELQEELENGDTDEAKEILQDIIQNLEKIHHHGERASGIVKSMLDHSRTSSGEKVPTDINQLADEYLRLAYHGLRAKDRSFNASFETSFDASIPKINVVVQDFGRVLLNLINNAFHAVSEKDKSLKGPQALSGVSGYQPKVTVSTKGIEGNIIIEVSDNGPGIPDEIKEKIFQPFFTTKPTGEGTGLGLSLAYDIVQAHGGKVTVDSQENRGTKFIVTLKVES